MDSSPRGLQVFGADGELGRHKRPWCSVLSTWALVLPGGAAGLSRAREVSEHDPLEPPSRRRPSRLMNATAHSQPSRGEVWTVARVLRWAQTDLSQRGVNDSPRLDAELLLSRAIGLDRVQLIVEAQRPPASR